MLQLTIIKELKAVSFIYHNEESQCNLGYVNASVDRRSSNVRTSSRPTSDKKSREKLVKISRGTDSKIFYAPRFSRYWLDLNYFP